MSNWTPAQLEKLEAAIAKGVTSVQYEDRRIQYRDLDEMMQIRDVMRRELNPQRRGGRSRRRLARHDKGFN